MPSSSPSKTTAPLLVVCRVHLMYWTASASCPASSLLPGPYGSLSCRHPLALLVESGAQGRRLRTMCFLLPPPETPHHSLFTRYVFQLHRVTGVQQMWPCLCTWCSLGLECWLDTFPSAGLTGASFHLQPGLINRKLSLPPSWPASAASWIRLGLQLSH